MSTDTVTDAQATPDQPQPFKELGLTADEYARITGTLGRRPTDAELALYSVMWSEHCSYKSSKVHLRQFGAKAPATTEAKKPRPSAEGPVSESTACSGCGIRPTT